MSNVKLVVLTVESVIKMQGEEDQVMELITEGKFYDKMGSRYFIYQESHISGMEGDKTMLKLSANKVVMHRYGEHNSELSFEENKRHESDYNTPYGPFKMEVLASKVDYEVAGDGAGFIHLKYEMSIKGIGKTKTTMKITSRAVGSEQDA
jgi:uncharacterized beta-barrel protein YwiB (DUF1934 family)